MKVIPTPPAAAPRPTAPTPPSLDKVQAQVASIVNGPKLVVDVVADFDQRASIVGQIGPARGYASATTALRAASRYNYRHANDTATVVANAAGRYVMLSTDKDLFDPEQGIRGFRTPDERVVGLTTHVGRVIPRQPWKP